MIVESNAYKSRLIPDVETLLRHFARQEMVQLSDVREGRTDHLFCRITAVKEEEGVFQVTAIPWASSLVGDKSWVVNRYEFEAGDAGVIRVVRIVICLTSEAVEVYMLQALWSGQP
jgi:hypothetical protein